MGKELPYRRHLTEGKGYLLTAQRHLTEGKGYLLTAQRHLTEGKGYLLTAQRHLTEGKGYLLLHKDTLQKASIPDYTHMSADVLFLKTSYLASNSFGRS